MKNITDFIAEAMQLNVKEFCLVEPLNKMYDEFINNWPDAMLLNSNPGIIRLFVLRKADAVEYEGQPNIKFYEIPNKYKTLDDVDNAYENGDIDTADLEEIKKFNI